MEVYKLDKVIDLHVAMEQIKKLKNQLYQSLKRRKELATQMNENLYIKEINEDICRERSSDEVDATIEDLIGRNLIL